MRHTAHAYSPAVLWEPTILLPSQLPPRNEPGRSPEMRLVAAVFEDALQCIMRTTEVHGRRRRREYVEACDWLWDDDRTWPFAFGNVCDILGLDAVAVRDSVWQVIRKQGRASEPPKVKRPDSPRRPRRWDHEDLPNWDPAVERARFEIVMWDEA